MPAGAKWPRHRKSMPDIAISMGCGVKCPFIGRDFDDDWGLEDPTGKPDEEYLKVIAQIQKQLKRRFG